MYEGLSSTHCQGDDEQEDLKELIEELREELKKMQSLGCLVSQNRWFLYIVLGCLSKRWTEMVESVWPGLLVDRVWRITKGFQGDRAIPFQGCLDAASLLSKDQRLTSGILTSGAWHYIHLTTP